MTKANISKCKYCDGRGVLAHVSGGLVVKQCTSCGHRKETFVGEEYRLGWVAVDSPISNPKWLFEMPFNDDEDDSIDESELISYNEEYDE